MKKIVSAAVAAVAMLLAVGAHAAESKAAESKSVDEYTLVIKDHRFTPDVLEIPAGKKVKLIIDNQDPTPEEFESHSLHREKVIGGNKKGIVSVGPLKAGEYEFFGEFNMATAKGKIVVK